MSDSFVSSGMTAGQLNALVKKLGGKEAAEELLRGELVVTRSPHAGFKWQKVHKLLGLAAQFESQFPD